MKKGYFLLNMAGLFIIICLLAFRPKKIHYLPISVNPVATGRPTFETKGIVNILIDSSEAADYIDIYRKRVRRPLGLINDKLSKAVWFDTAAFNLLNKYIENPDSALDGVRMNFI